MPPTINENENSFDSLQDNINYQTNQVQPGETSQIAVILDKPIQQLQVPNINQTEASGHETSSQLEQIRHVQPDDTIVDMTQLSQHEPSSQIMQNNLSQMDMEEPLPLQDNDFPN
ncbi:Hypothetical predicted protein [Paramuricea clavata]|uniref:Uncharacterized protein n=1 Tax=Paramuricea clavata TaxID=317549 RepID=A0A6S7FSE1_PARCT|nr:Hypothetical predicted protein [Paramuricea clavata]